MARDVHGRHDTRVASKPKVLIANRGEIAVRIIRTCREMGIPSVAVYSDADRDALHVEMADEAYRIGPALASDSYLSIGAILEAARESRATLVHPGYGFLAERAQFAQAVGEAGFTFVGPSPQAIEEMGDKAAARRLADAAGMPIVPGTREPVDIDEAKKQAPRIGYPLLVKAAFGGGGKGMHVVRDARAPRGVAQAGGARGAVVLRTARGVPRALRRPRPPHRGADHRRHARQRRVPGRARLLGAAPTPEADRGDAVRRWSTTRCASGSRPRRPRSCARPATSTPARSSASSTRTARSTSSR